MLHGLDHDDRVVHHQTDGQHQAEERERVDGEAKQREKRECANQRHRHGQQRNQCRPPALQEDEHDDDDQHDRLDQRLLDLLHALGHGQRGVESDDIVETRRKTLASASAMSFLRAVCGIQSALDPGSW